MTSIYLCPELYGSVCDSTNKCTTNNVLVESYMIEMHGTGVKTVWIQIIPSHLFKMNLNIILLLHLGVPSYLFSEGFHNKILHTLLFYPKLSTHPAHLIFLDLETP
jgi:hypothetical protein